MGGERFDTPQPEAYLFGENADLNFLGSRPTVVRIFRNKIDRREPDVHNTYIHTNTKQRSNIQFPYPPPQTIEPTRTLKSLVNIRKESVRFTKIMDTTDSAMKPSAPLPSPTTVHAKPSQPSSPVAGPAVSAPPTTSPAFSYNIEFVYDADAKCAITIYYFCTEEVTSSGCR